VKTVWAVLVGAYTLACGGSEMQASNPNGQGPQQCPIVLSGAVTAGFACDGLGSVAGTYDATKNVSSIALSRSAGPSDASSVDIDISFAGRMRTGTFTMTDTPATAVSQVSFDGTRSYGAFSAIGSSPAQGSYTLTVSAVNGSGTTDGVTTYLVHGSLDATLLPIAGGGTGTVTLHATF
jgi:hypothetical protein